MIVRVALVGGVEHPHIQSAHVSDQSGVRRTEQHSTIAFWQSARERHRSKIHVTDEGKSKYATMTGNSCSRRSGLRAETYVDDETKKQKPELDHRCDLPKVRAVQHELSQRAHAVITFR